MDSELQITITLHVMGHKHMNKLPYAHHLSDIFNNFFVLSPSKLYVHLLGWKIKKGGKRRDHKITYAALQFMYIFCVACYAPLISSIQIKRC